MTRALVVALALAVGLLAGVALRAPQESGPAPIAPGDTAAPEQLWTCGMHPQVLRREPGLCPICGMALTPVQTHGDDVAAAGVLIDPVAVQNMGIRVAPLRRGPLVVEVRAAGVLAEAEPAQHDVTLRVGGIIERLYANTDGMHVARGAPLFDLQSPDLDAAVGELIAARQARERMRTGSSATTTAVVDAVERKLRRWNLPPAEIARLARLDVPPRTIRFTSPVDGHVVMKDVVEGAAVEADRTVLRIVDHRTLWLDARVFEGQLGAVRIGQPATARLDADPGRAIDGTVSFIHPHVDPATRTATVRIAVPNPTLMLRPGMFATVVLTAEVARDALLVPREAVIDTGTRRIAFVARAGGRFEPRELQLGPAGDGPDGPAWAVERGLDVGDEVVVSGQFLLDAESRLREGIRQFRDEQLLRPPSAPPAGHTGGPHP